MMIRSAPGRVRAVRGPCPVAAAVVLLAAMFVAAGAGAAPVTVDDFTDILFWTGSGSNAAALLLQFPTVIGTGTAAQTVEPAAIAWGYRWNGAASFESMLFALAGGIVGGPRPVAGADPRLVVDVSYYGPEWGYFVNEIAYDQVGLGPGWSPLERHIGPYDPDTGEYPAQYQLDTAAGQWSGAPLDLSMSGISTTPLVPGGWYGFVQADGSAGTFSFTQPVAAVPEPSALVLLGGGVAAWWWGAARRGRRWRRGQRG